MFKVLIVEDDTQIAKSLSMNLKLSGFEVAHAETVTDAWKKISNFEYDILLLDVNLPDGTGFDLCKKVRQANKTVPILFLSAHTDEENVVRAMNLGAEDYIRKPFGTEELKARMARVLKIPASKRNLLVAGPLEIDLGKRLASINGDALTLSRKEFELLIILAKRAGDVVSRESILTQLDGNSDIFDRTIDSHISHLRSRIKEKNETVKIVPVYGIGYRLDWKPS